MLTMDQAVRPPSTESLKMHSQTEIMAKVSCGYWCNLEKLVNLEGRISQYAFNVDLQFHLSVC